MQSFHWDKNYLTGLKDVDEQHHQLVDMLNSFSQKVTKNIMSLEGLSSLFK